MFPPKKPKSKKNREYIKNLDKRLASARMQINRSKKYEQIKEKEIISQIQDRPQISEGTKRIMENVSIKNVFERQKLLIQAQKKISKELYDKERYNALHGITDGPVINQRSKSLHRTIDDLYQWEQK